MKIVSAFKRNVILDMNTHFIWNALSNHEFEMFVKFNGIIKKKKRRCQPFIWKFTVYSQITGKSYCHDDDFWKILRLSV
ncbi:hypothetical protein VC88_09080 [Geobacillus sp. A8]|nr:hypothetical protein VC88_09080 [Geobacillus sp. A8]